MPRFVVLEHDYPELHWDLMLEAGDVLRTWRLSLPPTREQVRIPALALADHRTAYLDYEGPVSGNRGRVQRWDWGEYTEGPHEPEVASIGFDGQKIKGMACLRRVSGPDWELEWLSETGEVVPPVALAGVKKSVT